jgi:hypothetical protein
MGSVPKEGPEGPRWAGRLSATERLALKCHVQMRQDLLDHGRIEAMICTAPQQDLQISMPCACR